MSSAGNHVPNVLGHTRGSLHPVCCQHTAREAGGYRGLWLHSVLWRVSASAGHFHQCPPRAAQVFLKTFKAQTSRERSHHPFGPQGLSCGSQQRAYHWVQPLLSTLHLPVPWVLGLSLLSDPRGFPNSSSHQQLIDPRRPWKQRPPWLRVLCEAIQLVCVPSREEHKTDRESVAHIVPDPTRVTASGLNTLSISVQKEQPPVHTPPLVLTTCLTWNPYSRVLVPPTASLGFLRGLGGLSTGYPGFKGS